MHLAITNRLEEVFTALDRADDLLCQAQLALPQREDIRLVLEELMVNTVHYGYPDGGHGHIDMHLRIGPDAVVVELRDDGIPYDPLDHPSPVLSGDHADSEEQGGFGVHLVRSITSEVHYARDAHGNHIVLRFDHP
jgi:anti-sigma regulatory factor (Ser/Thr protein kinase)